MATSRLIWPALSATLPPSAAPGTVFVNGTNFDYQALAFDGSAQNEECWFIGVVPQQYTANSNFTIYLNWTTPAGPSASDNVSWDVGYLGATEDDVFDVAMASDVTTNDLVTAAADLHTTAVAFGSPTLALGDVLVIHVQRDYDEANGGTAMTEDAYLLTVEFRQD